jgi:hypothetical protein
MTEQLHTNAADTFKHWLIGRIQDLRHVAVDELMACNLGTSLNKLGDADPGNRAKQSLDIYICAFIGSSSWI